jgi:hypothetical protein
LNPQRRTTGAGRTMIRDRRRASPLRREQLPRLSGQSRHLRRSTGESAERRVLRVRCAARRPDARPDLVRGAFHDDGCARRYRRSAARAVPRHPALDTHTKVGSLSAVWGTTSPWPIRGATTSRTTSSVTSYPPSAAGWSCHQHAARRPRLQRRRLVCQFRVVYLQWATHGVALPLRRNPLRTAAGTALPNPRPRPRLHVGGRATRLNGWSGRPALLAGARFNVPGAPTGATIPRWGNGMPHRPLN